MGWIGMGVAVMGSTGSGRWDGWQVGGDEWVGKWAWKRGSGEWLFM